MCPPSEPLTYGLYHHWVSTDASRQTWPSFPISAGKFLFRILVIDDDLRGPSWRRATCAKKVWELLWTGRAHGVGQGRAPLFRSRNPALLNGSLHPLLVLPAISLKLFKKQHVRGRLRNNCIQDYIPMPYLNLCFCTLSWFLLVSFSRYMQRNHCVFNIWSFLKLCSSSLLSKLLNFWMSLTMISRHCIYFLSLRHRAGFKFWYFKKRFSLSEILFTLFGLISPFSEFG